VPGKREPGNGNTTWEALRANFERGTLANKQLLKRKQYFRTEMKSGSSVELHLKRKKEHADKLAAIGE